MAKVFQKTWSCTKKLHKRLLWVYLQKHEEKKQFNVVTCIKIIFFYLVNQTLS